MSTDGFENTFVCVHAHLDWSWYLAANISAVQKEGVHLKHSLVLVGGLGQGNRGFSSVRNHFMLLLLCRQFLQIARLGSACFTGFAWKKEKKA